MSFPVIVQTANGHFEASLVGAPDVRATGPTRVVALAALEALIEKRVSQGGTGHAGDWPKGVAGLFGKYHDDPTLEEMCAAAYRERDADVHE